MRQKNGLVSRKRRVGGALFGAEGKPVSESRGKMGGKGCKLRKRFDIVRIMLDQVDALSNSGGSRKGGGKGERMGTRKK